MQSKFKGTGVALVTPFKNNVIDWDSLGNIIDYVIDGGVDYLVCLGTTGEAVTLSDTECRQILDFTLRKNDGRVPLVYGLFGGNNTEQIIERIASYSFDGIDAILSSSPNYIKPGQEGIYRHFVKLADHSPVPIIVYNVPSRTASNILSETTIRIAQHPNIMGVKEASGDMLQVMEIIKHKPDDFLVISGDDITTYPLMAAGGDGVISVIANAFPTEFSGMVRACLNKDFDTALKLNYQLLDIHWDLYTEGSPTGIKGVMEYIGLCSREVRLPLVDVTDATYQALKREIDLAFPGKYS